MAECQHQQGQTHDQVNAELLGHGRSPRHLATDAWQRFRHLSANVPADMTVAGMMAHLHLRTGDLWRQAVHQRLAEAIAAAAAIAPIPTSPHPVPSSHHQDQKEEETAHDQEEQEEEDDNQRNVGVKLAQLLHPGLDTQRITSMLELYWRRYNGFVDEVQFLVRHLFTMVTCCPNTCYSPCQCDALCQ